MRLRSEQELRNINEHLNVLVAERTKELSNTIEQLKVTQKELIQAEKMASLGALVAGVSHEVNTPLGVALTSSTSVIDRLEALQRSFDREELTEEELVAFIKDAFSISDILKNSISRASEIVKSFKMLATNQSSDEKRYFNLHNLVQSILVTLKYNYHQYKSEIHNDVAEELRVFGSVGDYTQIITNLIQNSLEHGLLPDDVGDVYVNANFANQTLIINVVDTGCGVPEDKFEQIFQPFYTTNRFQGGTGLGLSILYNLVTSMAGTITPYKNSPQGLGIEIVLPIVNNAPQKQSH